MKYISKLIFFAWALTGFFMACQKSDSLPYYKGGSATVLKSSVTAIAPAPADSSSTVVVFSWTNPHYATDSATVKYIIEIDSSGRNFSRADSFVMTGTSSASFTAKQINTLLLNYGFSFGVAYNMDVRIISSYGNNNDQQISNTLMRYLT